MNEMEKKNYLSMWNGRRDVVSGQMLHELMYL
jgi:hypothetical protein